MTDLSQMRDAVQAEIATVVVGAEETVELLLCAAAVGGHVLLDGVPGVAKTLTATALARVLGLDARRVQFTPDLLPSDLTGAVTLRGDELEFRPGPVFCQLLLADEINRSPPKTQAALLEAMQEGQVSADGEPRALPDPFFVVATRNPIDQEGTYPLPEAQLDRFLLQIDVGYPDREVERRLAGADREGLRPRALDDLRAVTDAAALREAARATATVYRAEAVVDYAVDIVRGTREMLGISLGASPRAAVHLLAAAQASAAFDGRDFVRPDDVRRLAAPVLAHRLMLSPEAELQRLRAADAVEAVVARVPVPT